MARPRAALPAAGPARSSAAAPGPRPSAERRASGQPRSAPSTRVAAPQARLALLRRRPAPHQGAQGWTAPRLCAALARGGAGSCAAPANRRQGALAPCAATRPAAYALRSHSAPRPRRPRATCGPRPPSHAAGAQDPQAHSRRATNTHSRLPPRPLPAPASAAHRRLAAPRRAARASQRPWLRALAATLRLCAPRAVPSAAHRPRQTAPTPLRQHVPSAAHRAALAAAPHRDSACLPRGTAPRAPPGRHARSHRPPTCP